jgi:endonuclease/exonuclease/phosphatase family metal-dependent hydrolase
MLIKEKADIVCLNEVDWKATWSYNINYVKYLAEKAGYNHYSFGTKWDQLWPFFWVRETDAIFPFLKVHIGNAILSKHPVVKAKNKSFDGEDAIDWLMGEHTYLDALIDVNGKELRTICTHLDSDSAENRIIEVKKLIQEARYSDVPIIIGTDFNSVLSKAKKRSKVLQREYQGDNAMDIIVNSGLFNVYMEKVDPADTRYHTSNSGEEYKTIDFIITTKDLEIEEYRVLHDIYSDHKAVFAKIKWK